jgi:hypothetical protein
MALTKQRRAVAFLPPELLQRITHWRRQQRDLPSEAEAIRRLLERGLDAEEADKTPPTERTRARATASISSLRQPAWAGSPRIALTLAGYRGAG